MHLVPMCVLPFSTSNHPTTTKCNSGWFFLRFGDPSYRFGRRREEAGRKIRKMHRKTHKCLLEDSRRCAAEIVFVVCTVILSQLFFPYPTLMFCTSTSIERATIDIRTFPLTPELHTISQQLPRAPVAFATNGISWIMNSSSYSATLRWELAALISAFRFQ